MKKNLEVGLCETCEFAKVAKNNRGSSFWRCVLAEENPNFAKYPNLPVLECAGFRFYQKPSSV